MEIINGVDQDDIAGDITDIDGATIDDSIIGGTTPATGTFTTLEVTGQLQGALINNQMTSKATYDILAIMAEPIFLNLQCEDPGAGTMADVSGHGHDGTYQGSMTSGDRIMKGMGWVLDLDETDDYVDIGAHNDLSFGDGSNDFIVTWFGMVEIVSSASDRELISKWDDTTGLEAREYLIRFNSDEKIYCYFYDESANVNCSRISDNGISVGFHSFAITYDGGGGGTAANGIKIYIDGSIIASTATNSGSYVSMENMATDLWLGTSKNSSGNPSGFYNGDIACIGVDGSEWSAKMVWRFHQLCKGLYGI